MKINLSPQRRDDTLAVFKEGDVFTINGEAFDFTSLPDGATIQALDVPCEWLCDKIERVAGELELTLLLPHTAYATEEVTFPQPIIDPDDGWLALPGQEVPQPEVPVDEEPVNVDP